MRSRHAALWAAPLLLAGWLTAAEAQAPGLLGTIPLLPSSDPTDTLVVARGSSLYRGALAQVFGSLPAATTTNLGSVQVSTGLVVNGSGALSVAYGTTAGTAAAGDDSRITGAAPLASPALTGTPTAPTPATADNSTKLATTAWGAANLGLKLDKTGGTLTGQVIISDAAANSGAGSLVVSATGNTNGVNFKLTGNGSTTPSKTIRVINGQLQVLNDAYSSSLLTLTDAGALTVAAATAQGDVAANAVNTGGMRRVLANNASTAAGTFSRFSAVTGTSNAYVNLDQWDGTTPYAWLYSGTGNTGGLRVTTAAAGIALEPNNGTVTVNGALQPSTPLAAAYGGTGSTGGAWTASTPAVSAASGTLTSASAAMRGLKMGRLFLFNVDITVTTNGSGATGINLAMPYTAAARCNVTGRSGATGNQLQGQWPPSTTTLSVFTYNNGYPGADSAVLSLSGFCETTS